MAKSAIERAIEKQQREAKKIADKQLREAKKAADTEARRQRASSIVNGQPLVGGMRMMDASAEEILTIIHAQYDGNENREAHGNFEVIPDAYRLSLQLEFEKLSMYGMITNPFVAIDAVWDLTLTPQGISYFDDKKAAQIEAAKAAERQQMNIGNINAPGSNFVFGNVVNSTLTVDNSVEQIQREIEEKGGADKEELRALLDEVKELAENIQESHHIPKNKNLFTRLTNHLDTHGWFYAEIVGLLGGVAVQLLQG